VPPPSKKASPAQLTNKPSQSTELSWASEVGKRFFLVGITQGAFCKFVVRGFNNYSPQKIGGTWITKPFKN
jgi:hypothetical protein